MQTDSQQTSQGGSGGRRNGGAEGRAEYTLESGCENRITPTLPSAVRPRPFTGGVAFGIPAAASYSDSFGGSLVPPLARSLKNEGLNTSKREAFILEQINNIFFCK